MRAWPVLQIATIAAVLAAVALDVHQAHGQSAAGDATAPPPAATGPGAAGGGQTAKPVQEAQPGSVEACLAKWAELSRTMPDFVSSFCAPGGSSIVIDNSTASVFPPDGSLQKLAPLAPPSTLFPTEVWRMEPRV